MPLATLLREAFAERRAIDSAPGHLFEAGEADSALSFVVLSCLFLWDATLLPCDDSAFFHLSHDQYGLTFCRDHGRLGELRRSFERFELDFEVRDLTSG